MNTSAKELRPVSRRVAACFLAAVAVVGGCKNGAQHKSETAQTANAGASAGHSTSLSSAAASATDPWDRLMAGNARFASGAMEHPQQSVERVHDVAKGQKPFAIVLSCSDSRVPPEVVFDTGVGDLFVVRIAGNTANDAAIGSMEYAVEHLGASLIVVMGHQRCGAVQAAVQAAAKTGDSADKAPNHMTAFIAPILPAATAAKQMGGADVVDEAIRDNVLRVVDQLQTSEPILAERAHDQKLTVVGCYYDLDSGQVSKVDRATVAHH